MPPTQAAPLSLPHATGHAQRPRRTSRLWLSSGVLLALAVGTSFAYRELRVRRAPRFDFQTVAISRGPIAAKVSATGTLSALVMVTVGSQVSGRIASLSADFGSKVKAGQVVATIEPSLFAAAVQQARANHAAALAAIERSEAQLDNFSRAYERAQTLAEQRFISQADLDAASASLRVARADVKQAHATEAQTRAALAQVELNLRYTTILSPIDGVVISRNVDVGQTVAATLQAPILFTIAKDLTRMQVDTNVPEADVGKVREGMPVSFSVDAYPGRTFVGHVRQVRDNAQTQQNVVTYDAVIDVENDERLLKPGMTASVTFVYAERADALCVPNAALRFRPDPSALPEAQRALLKTPTSERVVWLLREGSAIGVPVRIGISDGVCSELLQGEVEPGARAIVELTAAEKSGS